MSAALKNIQRKHVDDYRCASIKTCLQESRDKGVVGKNSIEKREQIRVKRQPVKCQMVGQLPSEDSLCPIVVEVHVAARRQQKWRRREAGNGEKVNEKNAREDVVANRAGAFETRERFHATNSRKVLFCRLKKARAVRGLDRSFPWLIAGYALKTIIAPAWH